MLNKERIEKAIPFIVFFVVFFVYVFTMAPSIYWGDSPELIAVAYTLGIAHPSGYPLYTLLGKLFTFIPIGTIAYRLNIMSAFFASLAVMLLYFVAFKITKSRLAALLSSLTLGFSYTFWTQATIAEVYTLNAFFIIALILIIMKWTETMQLCYLYLFSFVFGLGLTNHLTLILTFPAFILFFFLHIKKLNVKNKSVINKRIILLMLTFFVIGLSLYIYLPLRAAQDPLINWGNPVSFKLFIEHVSGAGYQHYFRPEHALLNLAKAFVYLLMQFPLTLIFALLGIIVMWIRSKEIVVLTSLIAVFAIAYNIMYTIEDIIVYYIPIYIVFSIFIGIGLWYFLSFIKANFYAFRQYAYYALFAAAILLIISNPFLLLYIYNGEVFFIDRSKFYAADNYADFMLAYAKPGSIITGDSDNVFFPLIYYQAVEGKRSDLIVLYKGLLVTSPWYAEQLKLHYPKRELIVEENENNMSITFGTPTTLYFVLVNPSIVDTFNATFISEDIVQKFTATLVNN